jgi:hypothetical protein
MIVVLPVMSGLGTSLDYWFGWFGLDLVVWFGLGMVGLMIMMVRETWLVPTKVS